jgi:hypothetical protein
VLERECGEEKKILPSLCLCRLFWLFLPPSFPSHARLGLLSPTMVKPSMPMMARLRLTTKHTRGGYYKGNRTGSMGSFVQPSSKYEVDWNKARTYVVPTESLETFKVRSSN